jgi:hypothetical protein
MIMSINKIQSIFVYFLWLCLFLYGTGCDDNNNSLHQKYIDAGETIYTGKVDSVEVFSGYEKVKLTWQINSDPRINRVVISWNDGANSTEVPVTKPGDRMETVFDLPEGIYTLSLVTMDAEEHHSINVTKTARSYGSKYIATLNNRGMTFGEDNGILTIKWQPIENPLIQYVTVKYKDYANADPVYKTVRVENSESVTAIPNVRQSDVFSVVTTYLPEESFETFDALPTDYTILNTWYDKLLDKTKFASANLPGDIPGLAALPYPNWFDGSTTSLWVSADASFAFPMCVSLDFGVKAKLDRFRLWSQPGLYYANFTFRVFEVWGVDELKTGMPDSYWKGEDWKNDWVKLDDYEIKRPSGNTAAINNPTGEDLEAALAGFEFYVPRNVPPCRYVRFVIKTIWSAQIGAGMAEITIWGGNDGSFE